MALALATGIAPGAWEEAGEQAIVTAWVLLEKAHGKGDAPPAGQATGRPTRANPQMSG